MNRVMPDDPMPPRTYPDQDRLRAQVEADLGDIDKVLAGSEETREKLDHTLRAYARLEVAHAERSRAWRRAEARVAELEAALRGAAEDLAKAANQFAAIGESLKAGHIIEINRNPFIFTQKSERAYAALKEEGAK